MFADVSHPLLLREVLSLTNDREKNIKEVQTFLDTKIAPKEIVEELKVHSYRVSASVISLWFPAYFVFGFPRIWGLGFRSEGLEASQDGEDLLHLLHWLGPAGGVAAATLHACYTREIKQYMSGVTALSLDTVQVLDAADQLEKPLVQIAVEEGAEAEDGGKALIREMPPFEADRVVGDLARKWVEERLEMLGEMVTRSIERERWEPDSLKERYAPSAVELLRIVDAYFALPVSTRWRVDELHQKKSGDQEKIRAPEKIQAPEKIRAAETKKNPGSRNQKKSRQQKPEKLRAAEKIRKNLGSRKKKANIK